MSQENLVEFEDYLAAMGRRRKLIAVVVIAFALLGAAYSVLSTKVYTAESRVSVTAIFDPGAGTSEEVNIDTERGIAQSSAVALLAQRSLRTDTTASDLLDRVSVDPVGESTILAIRYTHTDPETAYRGAGAFAQAYLDFRASQADEATRQARQQLVAEQSANAREMNQVEAQIESLTPGSARYTALSGRLRALEGAQDGLQRQLQDLTSDTVDPGTIIDEAEVPTSPSSPGLLLNVTGGTLIGLVLALTIAFVLERKNLGSRPDPTDDAPPAVAAVESMPPGPTPPAPATEMPRPAAVASALPARSGPAPTPPVEPVPRFATEPGPSPASPARPQAVPALPSRSDQRPGAPVPTPAYRTAPRTGRRRPAIAGADDPGATDRSAGARAERPAPSAGSLPRPDQPERRAAGQHPSPVQRRR